MAALLPAIAGGALKGSSMLFSLFSLLLPIALIAAIVAALRSRRANAPQGGRDLDSGIGTVRRLFLYGITMVSLAFAAVGFSLLLGGALDALSGEKVIEGNQTELAVALSFTIVGTPVWLFFAWLAQRAVAAHPVERRSEARRLAIDIIRGAALVVIVLNAVEAGSFLLGVAEFEGKTWGLLAVWSGVWVIHHRLAAVEPATSPETQLLDRLYLYFAAIIGLILLILGVVQGLSAALSAAYDEVFRPAFIHPPWTEELREAISVTTVGAIAWAWHWLLRLARRDALSTLWRVQGFLFGILGGTAMVVLASASVLYAVLHWFLGTPGSDSAAEHFRMLPILISWPLAGAALRSYHRAALREAMAGPAEMTEAERIYRYLLAAAGLMTAAGGIATELALLIEVISGGDAEFVAEGWWRNQLVLGITLLLVGTSLWIRYWFNIQGIVREQASETAALSRRVYLFSLFGAAAIIVLIALTLALFRIFDALLGEGLTLRAINDSRWPISLALTAGALSIYHWQVLREDQRAQPAPVPEPVSREVILLTMGSDGTLLERELRGTPGIRLQVWRRNDGVAEEAELSRTQRDALRDELSMATGEHFILIPGPKEFQLIPYEPRG
ncbi:MAG: hypothetical protein EXR43_05230 [Dehalococcoidia bacterium]|nr:hypothetical protein [Dehalococcoidia bacterium]